VIEVRIEFYQKDQQTALQYQCGVIPIPGSGLGLAGLGIIPYSLDKIQGGIHRNEILAHPDKYSTPDKALNLILK